MKSSTLAIEALPQCKGTFLFLLVALYLNGMCRAETVVVPGALNNVEGNSSSLAPFFIEHLFPRFEEVSMRYQHVYNAGEFASFEPDGVRITTLWFRWDHDFSGPGLFITNIQFNLSTTSKSADNLSMNFSENVGPDDSVVIGPGPLDVRGGGGGASPSPFTIKFDLETPFDYYPSAGNLLLDVRNYTGGAFNPIQFQALDAQNTVGDGISIMYAQSVDALIAEDIGIASLGLITQFEFTPIPEPSSLALIGLCGAGCVRWAWARSSPRKGLAAFSN